MTSISVSVCQRRRVPTQGNYSLWQWLVTASDAPNQSHAHDPDSASAAKAGWSEDGWFEARPGSPETPVGALTQSCHTGMSSVSFECDPRMDGPAPLVKSLTCRVAAAMLVCCGAWRLEECLMPSPLQKRVLHVQVRPGIIGSLRGAPTQSEAVESIPPCRAGNFWYNPNA